MELQRATPTTLERLCMPSPKGLSDFGARVNLMVPNSLMLHASLPPPIHLFYRPLPHIPDWWIERDL